MVCSQDKYLLKDEVNISQDELNTRIKLANEFNQMPIEFFSNLRCFQPQVGCPNNCGFCSQFSSPILEELTEISLRNIISALKVVTSNYRDEFPLLAWDRDNHRKGVIFPYLDNDVGCFSILDKYINLLFDNLGVQTRISTVGFSRKNRQLVTMHRSISKLHDKLAGVRLSLAPFGKAWESCSGSPEEFEKDITNFFKIYRSFLSNLGAGERKYCVEFRYEPLVHLCNVRVFHNNNGQLIILTDDEVFISQDPIEDIEISQISDYSDHLISLTHSPIIFKRIDYNSSKCLEEIINNKIGSPYSLCNGYKFINRDGEYYSFNPELTKTGNYGINIYPRTENREVSGTLITERFLLNAMYSEKKKYGLNLFDYFESATWDNVENVMSSLIQKSQYLKSIKKEYISDYINSKLIPIIDIYIKSLKNAHYSPNLFFNKDFTIDTGIMCNLGRGLNYFKGITKKINEPLTPIHERNYGSLNSKMTQENIVWRLRCQKNGSLLIQQSDLSKTSLPGQDIILSKTITMLNETQKINVEKNYLVPGEKNKIFFYKEFGDLGYLASYSPHGFWKNNIYYKTTEHYFQSQKFIDPSIQHNIIYCNTPKEASKIGRDRNLPIREDWDTIRVQIMYDAVYEKFKQNPEICKKLIATGDAYIIEETTKENFWGCGPDYNGQNTYGKILCQVRKQLRNEVI